VTLLSALIQTRWAEASEPRDKIYALLGLTTDRPHVVPVPNYKQSLQEVFKDLTKSLLLGDPFLDMLGSRCLEVSPIENKPTWVPDWDQLYKVMTPVDVYYATVRGYSEEDPSPGVDFAIKYALPFHKDLDPMAEFRENIIKVRGVIEDTVDGLSTRYTGTTDSINNYREYPFRMCQPTTQRMPFKDESELAGVLMDCLT
jgi:hypothetical protein